jgi:hypothetical protein
MTTLLRALHREPRGRSLPSHQKRAGPGIWASARSRAARASVRRWRRSALFDPDLTSFGDAWPSLPDALKAGILAMIEAAAKGERGP